MNKPIPLVFDSTVYKQMPKLNSTLFDEIIKYTRAGMYRLYIPEVVEKEFLTWAKVEAQDSFDKVVKASRSLNKFYEEPKILGVSISFDSTTYFAEKQFNEILRKFSDNWNEFKLRSEASILPISESHGRLVMDAYFEGGPPFYKTKNRMDIPDAFIYFSMRDLEERSEVIVFVSSDKNFSKKVESEKVKCFSNLSELLASGPCKLDGEYFESVNAEDKSYLLFKIYADEIKSRVSKDVGFSDIIEDKEDDFIQSVIGEYDSFSAEVEDLNFMSENIVTISRLSILVPFSAKVICSIESNAEKNDLNSVSDERLKNVEKEVNDDGSFELCERRHLSVCGHCSVSFSETNPATWRRERSNNDIWIEPETKEITVALEDIQLGV